MPATAPHDETTTTTAKETDAVSPARAVKKQKTASASSSSSGAVKAVKAVDPAIILQRRDAVQQRVLKLESKLAKDRALLAKYTVPYAATATATTNGSDESEDKATGTGDEE
jgi:hypothetical protein